MADQEKIKQKTSNEESTDKVKPDVDKKNKFIVDSLNIHGSFFHKKCIEIIANQLSFSVIEKEFPIGLDNSFTKIDIVAERSGSVHNFFIFECKKIDNDFKTWVFFPDIHHGKNDVSVYKKKNYTNPLILDALLNVTSHSSGDKPQIKLLKYFITPKDGSGLDVGGDICYDAYQIRMDYDANGEINIKNIQKAAKKNDIEKACNQVLLGCRGYAIQKNIRIEKGDKTIRAGGLFIPIVVTTSKLMVCDISSEDVDLSKGIVTDYTKAKLRKVNWVVYNYKPNFMLNEDSQIPFYEKSPDYQKESESMDYIMSAYIVNADALNEFLEKIQWIGS